MIISHKHKFIFIKTHKTGGTSMEIALSKICGDEDIITKIIPEDERERKLHSGRTNQNETIPKFWVIKRLILHLLEKPNNIFMIFKYICRLKFYKIPELELVKAIPKIYQTHMTASKIKQFIAKKKWNEYYKFTIERNPFDAMVSLYFFLKKTNKQFYHYNNIDKFIKDILGREGNRNYLSYTINNRIAVDKIYLYEDGFEAICLDITKRLSLKEPLVMPKYKAKSQYREFNGDKNILNDTSLRLIKKYHKEQIKMFGYGY